MKNRTALVTGASRGIGAAIARELSAQGWNLVLNYCYSRQKAEALAASLPNAAAVQADVSQAAEVERLVAEGVRLFGRIDLLVNNAGIAEQKLFTELSEEDWDRMLAVNLKSVFLACRAVLPGMIRRQEGGIINISSIWGITGASCEVHYSAAKAGMIGLTRALAQEVGPSNIRVNCVAPGVIRTEMCEGLGEETLSSLREETPIGRLGTPEDIAYAVAFLASERAGFITGQVLSPNGGLAI